MAVMITTEDNPHDPRTDFNAWYTWDLAQGYNTCAWLDRVASLAEGFPQPVIDVQIEQAIDEIIALHAGGFYKKLPLDEDPPVEQAAS